MKPYLAILAGLVVAAPMARAQVIIHQAALDQLAGIPPAVITVPQIEHLEARPAPHKVTYQPVVHRHVSVPPAAFASANVPKPVMAPKPALPVPPAAAPQVQAVVAKPVIPKPPPLPASAEIAFAAGAADLPAGVSGQLKPFCATGPSGPITIDAYAAADPGDPSAALRLSMSRVFALRDALVACGVPSTRIIPRADGAGKNPDVARISIAP